MRARSLVTGLALALGAAATFAGCFSPREPACAFSCGPAGACPESYACGADNLCHRVDDDAGRCLIDPQDGGADADASDVGADLATDEGADAQD